jgi:hypothetical protein
MFKYNSHNLNYNLILKHVFLNKTKKTKNSYLKLQIQILIFRFKLNVSKLEEQFSGSNNF